MATDFFRWSKSDAIIGHGLGILIDPLEMSRLMRCRCRWPNLKADCYCAICDRLWIFQEIIIPALEPPPAA